MKAHTSINGLCQGGSLQLGGKKKKNQQLALAQWLILLSIFTDLFSSRVSLSARRLCSAISSQ